MTPVPPPQPVGFVSFDSRSEAEAAKNALNVSVPGPATPFLHFPLVALSLDTL